MQQDMFDLIDGYTQLDKQSALLDMIFRFEAKAQEAIDAGVDVEEIAGIAVRERIGRAKSIPYDRYKAEFDKINKEIDDEINALVAKQEA